VKWLVLLAFIGIIGSLASALFFMMRDKGKTKNMVKALGIRVGLSIALFLCILFSYWMGWIQTTGIPMR
jgi:Protein of unknown function (DUF2909)